MNIFRTMRLREPVFQLFNPFAIPRDLILDKLQIDKIPPHVDKDGFQVCMDVSHFTPNELSVKVVDDTVVVEGKHDERKDDHGIIQRHFIRKYSLPEGFDPKDVVSTISSDGVLVVKAPPPPSKAKSSNEYIVQIQQTGPAHLSVKQPEELKNQKNEETGNISKGNSSVKQPEESKNQKTEETGNISKGNSSVKQPEQSKNQPYEKNDMKGVIVQIQQRDTAHQSVEQSEKSSSN